MSTQQHLDSVRDGQVAVGATAAGFFTLLRELIEQPLDIVLWAPTGEYFYKRHC